MLAYNIFKIFQVITIISHYFVKSFISKIIETVSVDICL